jgi:mannose-6-phosphate isomerase-like protein (cupin superfamily)
MKHKTLRFGKGFNVVLGNRRSQAAQMVLTPGKSEGSAQNRHRGSDQWLLVIRGTGTAIVNRRRYRLVPARLFLIEHGDKHEIRNDGSEDLVTLNFYVPPGYSTNGKELTAAKPGEGGVSAQARAPSQLRFRE